MSFAAASTMGKALVGVPVVAKKSTPQLIFVNYHTPFCVPRDEIIVCFPGLILSQCLNCCCFSIFSNVAFAL